MAENIKSCGEGEAKLWGGRFAEQTSQLLEKLNNSIDVDRVMWKQDIEGSIAYCNAQRDINLLTETECETLVKGLKVIANEWESQTFKIKHGDEDIHTANERRLKELVGTVGGKLHTGRSRNDQVALDMRMWTKEHITDVRKLLVFLIEVMLERVEKESGILMPGYTHLQRAQAIRWAHWILSHAWCLYHDLRKLENVYTSTDMCPLGSGALAGHPLGADRHALSTQLGFSAPTPNSLLAVADRDFIADYLYWSCLTATHLSKLAEDLILYSSAEFGYVNLSDSFSTGSSLMPQKKNPDSLELIRGKAGRLLGNLSGFLCVMKGLPSTYNKDLQEDKRVLFDSAETMDATLKLTAGVFATLKVNEKNCQKALTEDLLATDLAYYLVKKGVPFREAHEKVGEVVKLAETLGCQMSHIPKEEMKKLSHHFDTDVSSVWDFEHSVEQYTAHGGTALSSVKEQASELHKRLKDFKV